MLANSLDAPSKTGDFLEYSKRIKLLKQAIIIDVALLPDPVKQDVAVLSRPILVEKPASKRDVTSVSWAHRLDTLAKFDGVLLCPVHIRMGRRNRRVCSIASRSRGISGSSGFFGRTSL